MALVDYSDSDSDSDSPPPKTKPTTSTTTVPTKKPFQKLIDRSAPGGKSKILVNLPSASSAEAEETPEQPPAKRAKTTASTSRFSAFSSFLPPPKKNNSESGKAGGSVGGGGGIRGGFSLKTGAEPAFVRGGRVDDGEGGEAGIGEGGMSLPAPKGPTIPEGQKPEEEVKLVGKPLMFKPLSVTRKPAKKRLPPGVVVAGKGVGAAPTAGAPVAKVEAKVEEAPVKKKVSLFSVDDEDDAPTKRGPEPTTGGAYEPLFSTDQSGYAEDDNNDVTSAYESYVPPLTNDTPQYQSTSAITDGMHLSEQAQRELFGRRGAKNGNEFALPANARVINFNMEKEYEHNEALRASGEQAFNPVRSIAPGKHSLRQMVNMAQNNQSALEDSFAQARNNKSAAAGRYGWK